MATSTGSPIGIPTSSIDDRPDANDFEDGQLWFVRTSTGAIVPYEVRNGDWTKIDFGDAGNRVNKVNADNLAVQSADIHALGTVPDGIAELNDQDELLSSQVPDLAITSTYVVADQTERLSLDVQEGDVAIQEDIDGTYIFTGGDSSDDANWSAFQTPAAPVQSVFTRTGDVSAQSGDYALDQIDNVEVSQLLEGNDADKPAASEATRWYWAKDTQILYRDNGVSWTAVAGAGSADSKLPTQHAETLDFNRTKEPQAVNSASSSYTVDLLDGSVHKLTMTGDVSIDISNVDTAVVNQLVLYLVQDSTGGRTPSFTPTVRWPGGSAPSWSSSSGAVDVVTLIYDPDAGAWDGFPSGLGMA